MRRLLTTLSLLLAAASAQDQVSFNRDVRPILADRCFPCHGPDKATRQAGLRLDLRDHALGDRPTSAPAFVPGDADAVTPQALTPL